MNTVASIDELNEAEAKKTPAKRRIKPLGREVIATAKVVKLKTQATSLVFAEPNNDLTSLDLTSKHFKLLYGLITPTIAAKMLLRNTQNRSMAAPSLASYKSDKLSGRWLQIGDIIRFDWNGLLADGQKRLQSCVETDIPFWAVIALGIDPRAMDVIDTGQHRSLADLLKMRGEADPSQLAASLGWLVRIKTNDYSVRQKISTPFALEILERNPRIRDSVRRTQGVLGHRPSLLTAVHYIGSFLLEEPDTAAGFVSVFKAHHKIDASVPAYPNCAATTWRTMLAQAADNNFKIERPVAFPRTIHAYNRYRKQKPFGSPSAALAAKFDDLNLEKI